MVAIDQDAGRLPLASKCAPYSLPLKEAMVSVILSPVLNEDTA